MIMTTDAPATFDLIAYARKHRYRVRNLHDGHPVPPAIYRGPKDHSLGAWGQADRWDAIVGHRGYVAMDGDRLTLCVFFTPSERYVSNPGVRRVVSEIEALGGQVDQEGDNEVGATLPVEQIEEALKLIRASKLRLTNPGGNPSSLAKTSLVEREQSPDSLERSNLDPEYPETVSDDSRAHTRSIAGNKRLGVGLADSHERQDGC